MIAKKTKKTKKKTKKKKRKLKLVGKIITKETLHPQYMCIVNSYS